MPGGRLAEPDVLVYLGAKVARDQIIADRGATLLLDPPDLAVGLSDVLEP